MATPTSSRAGRVSRGLKERKAVSQSLGKSVAVKMLRSVSPTKATICPSREEKLMRTCCAMSMAPLGAWPMAKAATRRISSSIHTSTRTQAVAPAVHRARDKYPFTEPGVSRDRINSTRPYSQSTKPNMSRVLGSGSRLRPRRSTASAMALAA